MSSPQSPALQEAFNTFDEDGSGFVDLQELIRCLRSLNVNHVTDAQIERRFKEADVDGSGAIDFAEFYGLWYSLTRPNEVTLQEVKDILRKRVVDRTGAQLQRLAKFLQQKQPFFQQLQPEVVRDVASALQPGGQQSRLSGKGIGRLVASLGPGDALGEMALLKQGGLRTATVQATTECEVIIMHRSIFESLMRTLKGHLLYQAEYLSRLLVKPPSGRSEADVLKLASYLTSLQRFQEVPQPKLVQLAKEVTYAELAVGTVICRQGDDGDCMYIILRGSCNVHVDPDFDETAQAGALQKASLQPKVLKKKQPMAAGLTAKHLLRPGTGHLERLSSTASTRSDMSTASSVTASSRRSTESHDGHPRRSLVLGEASVMSKGRAIAAAMAGAIDGESPKLTDDQVVLLEQQYGPLDRNLPTGGSFGELSLADSKLARRNATIIAAEPASLIRIDKQLYRKTLYEMQLTATAEKLAFLRQVPIFEGSNSRQLTQLHFVLEKCTVQRGHIIILEDGEGESMPNEAADMQAPQWGGGATMSWWGLNGRDGQVAGRLPGVTGKFQQVAILGPAEFIGEVVASKHKFTAVAECECDLLWLKPQELHMLGSKSLGLAMQYSALRVSRWHQHQKAASLLPQLHSMHLVNQGASPTTSSGKRRAARKRPASAAVSNMAGTASSPADVTVECVALPAAHCAAGIHRLRPGVMHLPTAKEGVMGRMQCLQSAVSKPAHWSIASTQLHTRPKAEAFRLKGRVQVPCNVLLSGQ
ncbi:hypothetical protein WJX79_004506 [Trebouxia sp. C0005]